MKTIAIASAVFISGAVTMVLELAGSRILAPYAGTSLAVWTSLIGVILTSISAGYFFGGRIADRKPSAHTLALIILCSGLFIAVTAFVKEPVLRRLLCIEDLGTRAILGCVLLFAPASAALGTVPPFAARLWLTDVSAGGRTVGTLGAISTAGCIAGTFFGGFFLIAWIGITKLLLLLALLQVCAAVPMLGKKGFFSAVFLAVAVLAEGFMLESNSRRAEIDNGFFDIDTHYYHIWINRSVDEATGWPVRNLILEDASIESSVFIGSDSLVFEQSRMHRLAEHFRPHPKKTLMLGSGIGTYPRDFLRRNPDATMDAVEIDPAFADIGRCFFGINEMPRQVRHFEDGRVFLNKATGPYDIIFGDAFRSSYAVPFQLATIEAVRRMHDLLADDGIVLLNCIAALQGPKSAFLQAELATYRAVFPQVLVFKVYDSAPGEIQNLILIALKTKTPAILSSDNPEFQRYLGKLWTNPIPDDFPVLTDDYAPVDQYLAKTL